MKILHTADWHVGKALGGRSRMTEHEQALAEIVSIAGREDVDLVLVAGDLFDVTSPTPDAERVVYQTLLALSEVAPVVAVSGNHDNARRFQAIAPLFAQANVSLHSFVSGEGPLEIKSGAGETARIAILPWVSQRHIVKADALMAMDAAELTGEFRERMNRIITALGDGFDDDSINIFLGHVTIAGGQTGGGERTAQTIFDYWIDSTAFPTSAHYVALGHLHKKQRMLGPCPIYYSGSPLQLDFSDDDAGRYVLVVDAAAGVPARIDEVALESGRSLRTIEGTLAQLEALAGQTGDDYLRVRVRGPRKAGLGDEIRSLFPEAVKIVVANEEDEGCSGTQRDRAGLSPGELFSAYLQDRDIEDPRMVDLFQSLYDEVV